MHGEKERLAGNCPTLLGLWQHGVALRIVREMCASHPAPEKKETKALNPLAAPWKPRSSEATSAPPTSGPATRSGGEEEDDESASEEEDDESASEEEDDESASDEESGPLMSRRRPLPGRRVVVDVPEVVDAKGGGEEEEEEDADGGGSWIREAVAYVEAVLSVGGLKAVHTQRWLRVQFLLGWVESVVSTEGELGLKLTGSRPLLYGGKDVVQCERCSYGMEVDKDLLMGGLKDHRCLVCWGSDGVLCAVWELRGCVLGRRVRNDSTHEKRWGRRQRLLGGSHFKVGRPCNFCGVEGHDLSHCKRFWLDEKVLDRRMTLSSRDDDGNVVSDSGVVVGGRRRKFGWRCLRCGTKDGHLAVVCRGGYNRWRDVDLRVSEDSSEEWLELVWLFREASRGEGWLWCEFKSKGGFDRLESLRRKLLGK